jgi:hypothetical protein
MGGFVVSGCSAEENTPAFDIASVPSKSRRKLHAGFNLEPTKRLEDICAIPMPDRCLVKFFVLNEIAVQYLFGQSDVTVSLVVKFWDTAETPSVAVRPGKETAEDGPENGEGRRTLRPAGSPVQQQC